MPNINKARSSLKEPIGNCWFCGCLVGPYLEVTDFLNRATYSFDSYFFVTCASCGKIGKKFKDLNMAISHWNSMSTEDGI